MIVKTAFYAPRVFCQGKPSSFQLNGQLQNVFQNFVGFFGTLANKLQKIVKIAFLTVSRIFFRSKDFPRKDKQFDTFFQNSSGVVLEFWVKNAFLAGNYQHS